MKLFKNIQNFLINQFSMHNAEAGLSEEDKISYFEALKALEEPEMLSLDGIKGDTIIACYELSNVMRSLEVSDSEMDTCFERLQEMNTEIEATVVGVVKAKPHLLEQGINTLRNNASMTASRYRNSMELLAYNMPNHVPQIMDMLADMNDVSAVKSIAVMTLLCSDHNEKAIECIRRMTPPEYDTYRSSEDLETLDGIELEDVIERLA